MGHPASLNARGGGEGLVEYDIDDVLRMVSSSACSVRNVDFSLLPSWNTATVPWRIHSVHRAFMPSPFLRQRYNVRLLLADRATSRVFTGFADGQTYYATAHHAFAEAYERYIFATQGAPHCTSNGFAAHDDMATAAINAFLEMVERDAILLTWFDKRPAHHQLQFAHEDVMARLLRRYGLVAQFFVMESDWYGREHFPVVLCRIHAAQRPWWWRMALPNPLQGQVCGFGCAPTEYGAAFKAFREAAWNAWAVFRNAQPLMGGGGQFHFRYYLQPHTAAAFNFMQESPCQTISWCDVSSATPQVGPDQLLQLIRAFIRDNQLRVRWKVYARRDPGHPFFVVKCVIEEFRELWFGHGPDQMNALRSTLRMSESEGQTWPHPIP